MQICRRGYELRDPETGLEIAVENHRLLSPKDLCTLPFLDRMIGAGVRTLKIEGRARSAEYVKRVVEVYNEAVAAIVADSAAALLKEGIEVGYSREVRSGFKVGEKEGGYYIGFSDENFEALLGQYLREKVTNILYGER